MSFPIKFSDTAASRTCNVLSERPAIFAVVKHTTNNPKAFETIPYIKPVIIDFLSIERPFF